MSRCIGIFGLGVCLILSPLLSSCGGPCTQCANVGGAYDETMAITNAGDSSCNDIYSRGDTVRLQVVQVGSRIDLSWGDNQTLHGTLNEDLSLQIDAFNGVAVDDNGGGGQIPLSMLLSGVFSGPEGSRTFDGVYQASATTEDCVTRIKTHWVQVHP